MCYTCRILSSSSILTLTSYFLVPLVFKIFARAIWGWVDIRFRIDTISYFVNKGDNRAYRRYFFYCFLKLLVCMSAMLKLSVGIIGISVQNDESHHGHCTNDRRFRKWDKKVRRDVI